MPLCFPAHWYICFRNECSLVVREISNWTVSEIKYVSVYCWGVIRVRKSLRNTLSNFSWICGLHNLKLSWSSHKLCIGFIFLFYIFVGEKDISAISTPLALPESLIVECWASRRSHTICCVGCLPKIFVVLVLPQTLLSFEKEPMSHCV